MYILKIHIKFKIKSNRKAKRKKENHEKYIFDPWTSVLTHHL